MRRVLAVCMAISLFSGMGLMFVASSDESRFIDPDSNDYINLADSLAAGKGYAQEGEPEIFRAPGYPVFIAPFRFLFPRSVIPIAVSQIILNTATIGLLWMLARMLFCDRQEIANFAVILQTAALSSVVFANKILSETLFTFMLVLFLLLLEMLRRELRNEEFKLKTATLALSCGTCAGSLMLLRAIFIPLMALALLYLLGGAFVDIKKTQSRRQNTTRIMLPALALMLAPFIAVYAGWTLRNSHSADYSGFSSVGQINIYRYYACQLMARENNISFAEQQGICTANLLAQGPQAKQAEFALKHGLPVIKAQPFRYAMMHLKSDLNSLLPAVGDLFRMLGIGIGEKGTLSVIHTEGIISGVKHYFAGNLWQFVLALPFTAMLFLRYAAAITGSIRIYRPEINITMLFYALAGIYLLVIPGAVSHPRFRVPVEPIISLFAAAGIAGVLKLAPAQKKSKGKHVP